MRMQKLVTKGGKGGFESDQRERSTGKLSKAAGKLQSTIHTKRLLARNDN